MANTKVVASQAFLGLTDSLPSTNIHTSDGGVFRISAYIEAPSLAINDLVSAGVGANDNYSPNGSGSANIGPHSSGGLPANATTSVFLQVKQNTQIVLSTQATNNGPGSPPYSGSSYDLYVVVEQM